MITQVEETSDWIYMFSTLKSIIEKIHNENYEPNILLADCAAEISNGFNEVFDLAKRIFCWAHVERAIETHLPGKADKIESNNKKERQAILDDIRLFQKHTEYDNWIPIARLLINKWKEANYSNDFIEYFQATYLKPHKIGWIDHYCDWAPCQTNSIESTNRYIKDKGTFRDRLSVVDFLKVLENGFVRNWSIDRSSTLKRTINGEQIVEQNKKFIPFMVEPSIKLKELTISYQWNDQNKTFKKYNGLICVPAGKRTTLTTNECMEYFKERKAGVWKSFKEAVDHRIYFVEINESNWKLSKCSCSWWSKNYTCKHAIAVSFRLKLMRYPDECKDVAMGCARRRGRPLKNHGALKRIENEKVILPEEEEVFSYSESDGESEIENDEIE